MSYCQAVPAARASPLLERIRPGDPDDPLLRQVLPIGAESEVVEGFVRDPLCEADATATPGLLSKYRGRSLIVTTGRCGVHCRFCFRRHHVDPPADGFAWHQEETFPGWLAIPRFTKSS